MTTTLDFGNYKKAASQSRAEPLAPLRAARSDYLAAALGRHAGAEAVAALAHQFARLVGPFHGVYLRCARDYGGLVSAR
jgi:hypothetical protein